jgi:methylenetetrahydrofolate--tRNA-(uracil-5-)-methyltransferase
MTYFAGQMTGVEGYVESASSGLVAGVCLAMQLKGKDVPQFPRTTAIGALSHYVAAANRHFQPMNVTFGLMEGAPEGIRKKEQKQDYIVNRALEEVRALKALID